MSILVPVFFLFALVMVIVPRESWGITRKRALLSLLLIIPSWWIIATSETAEEKEIEARVKSEKLSRCQAASEDLFLLLNAGITTDGAGPVKLENVYVVQDKDNSTWYFIGARRVHHGSHAGRQLENRPHGRSLLGRRDRRTRGRPKVFVAVVY